EADDGQLKWLGDDRHAAPAEFGDGFIHTGNVEAKVMKAREAQAVAQILIHRLRNRAGLAISEQLDEERIVRCRRKVGKVLIRIGPLVHDPEIELLDVPSFRGSEVWHAHSNVVALHQGERTLLVTSRDVDHGHDGAPVVLQRYEATHQSTVASPPNRGTRTALRMRQGAWVSGDACAVPPTERAAMGAIAATVAAMCSKRRRVVATVRPSPDRSGSFLSIDDPLC